MSLNDYLYKIGEAIFMELEEVANIVYPRDGQNRLIIILSNGTKFKLDLASEDVQAA
jgi:hypothetical protein